ncbi:dihydropteroate synthase [Acetobacteraceae bacterium KSS8]|uniref:Dihydropteroate synthase n=1 Tax=Endosaccharibacter trunci TaxID=2812733 RepID=A0ABT1W810_9PROT|nr:dihydropteroate synthase [Acetobacteraceae bacterium KSS8]
MTDSLIVPLGLLHGEAAHHACDAGLALPLAGGPSAFTVCGLSGPDGMQLVRVGDRPASWQQTLARLTRPLPAAGLPPGALVMGILNVTPDSFSDGGRHSAPAAAIDAALRMREQGADLIDVGGESTRPGAAPVTPAEEQDRVLPVVERLRAEGILVSVDTRNAVTMRAALRAGATAINDVSALAHDPEAGRVVAEAGCPVMLMHMRGTPQTMGALAQYDDVAVEVTRELAASVARAVAAGIAPDRILVDPGLGFAKTTAHNLELLRRLPILLNLGCRIVLGASRKRFVGEIGGEPDPSRRDPGSLAAILPALAIPDIVLRVHDVPGTVQAVRLWRAMHG